MPIVPAICTQCGARVEVNNALDAAICPFCNTAFIIEKAINQYHITQNININAGVVNMRNEPSLEQMYHNARTLIMEGAYHHCVYGEKYLDDKGRALAHQLFQIVKDYPLEERTRIICAAASANLTLHGESIIPYLQDFRKYVHLLREKDRELYDYLAETMKKKSFNYNKGFTTGLFALKVSFSIEKEVLDSLLVPEEGMDTLYLSLMLYWYFWNSYERTKNGYAYACHKIFNVLPADRQGWFIEEYNRRKRIQTEIVDSIAARKYKRAYELIINASVRYPKLDKLRDCFFKKTFSMRCTLQVDSENSSYYAPNLVFDALKESPFAMKEILGE